MDFVNALIRAWPDALAQKGGSDALYPFQLAAVSSQEISLTFHLLRSAPHLVVDDPEDRSVPVKERSRAQSYNDTISANVGVSTAVAPDHSNDCLELLHRVGSSAEPKMWKELLDLLRMDLGRSNARWRALHAASSLATISPSFLELAVRLCPEELQQKDESGRLPLHIIASLKPDHMNSRSVRIKTILEGFPSATIIRDKDGCLPLHRAVASGQSWSSLAALIRAAPETLSRRDGLSKLYPFQLAACSPLSQLNELYLLLVAAPHVLTHHMR
jgi:ankyrin repeat protein